MKGLMMSRLLHQKEHNVLNLQPFINQLDYL